MSRANRVLRSLVNWLLGVPPPEAHRQLAIERDVNKNGAIEAADRANITGMRSGSGPQEWRG